MKLHFSGLLPILCPKILLFGLQKPQILLPALVISFLGAAGQPKGEETPSPEGNALIQALSVGDTLPQLQLNNVYGVPNNKLALQGTRGKLLILDFFHTTCGSCIVKISKLDSLQKQFGERLQVILVTPEPLSYIQKWWPTNRYSRNFKLPVVAQDTLLHKLFPHQVISHFVWMDSKGIVRSTTGKNEVHEFNIGTILNGHWPRMEQKRDYFEFDSEAPLILPAYHKDLQRGGSPLFHTGFFEPIEGAAVMWKSGLQAETAKPFTRIINFTLARMITIAHDLKFWLQPSYIVYEGKHGESNNAWIKDLWRNKYCYEAVWPKNICREQISENLKADVERYFKIKSDTATREIACLELKLVAPDQCPPPGLPLPNPLTDSVHYQKIRTIKNLLAYLNKMPEEQPVVYRNDANTILDIWVPEKGLETRTDAAIMLNRIGFKLMPTSEKLHVLTITRY